MQHSFEMEMEDDFNTANAIAVIFDLVKEANTYLQESQTHTEVIEAFENTLNSWLKILGIQREEEALLDEEIEQLIEQRIEARKK